MYTILFAGNCAENRTKASGYEHIIDFSDPDFRTVFLDAADLPFGFIPTGTRGKRINLYFLEMISHIRAHNYDLIHNFHCDNQLLFSYPQNRNYATIATTHLNYHAFSRRQLNVLKSYDSVIVLNSREEKWLRERDVNAVFIPHGFRRPSFDFQPDIVNQYADKINIAFSGVSYRDYETLDFFLDLVKSREDIVLHILGQRKNTKNRLRDKKYPNVVIYNFLTDDDYYSILSCCDYSFLPLTFASANNTLLEAEFLGVRTIVPQIEGVEDYAVQTDNIFYSNREELSDIVSKLCKQDTSKELIEQVKCFEWDNIYSATKDVYIYAIEHRRG